MYAEPAAIGGELDALISQGRSAGPAALETTRAQTFLHALESEPYRYDLFQALRRLECAYLEHPRIGEALRPVDEPIRFAQEPSLIAAPSTIARFEPQTNGKPARLTQYFFGLLGPEGALPLHLTDHARQRVHHHHDPTFARFLDLFHHRLLALFYRAWAMGQPTVQRDRPEQDRFGAYVGSTFGLGSPAVLERDALPDHAKLYYAGLLASQPRNAEGLRNFVSDYLRMPATIEQWVGEWLTVPKEHRWGLGSRPKRNTGVLMGKLASTSLVGSRVWSRQHRFRIVLGPLRRDQFRYMLPGAPGLSILQALVRNYVGDEFRWDVRLVLRRDEARPLELGVSALLGRTSWLVARVGEGDWKDLILDPLQDYAAPRSPAAPGPRAAPARA
ncbi:MAG: type VI secretion system baseplate subunit TssG [Polyangiales bacterium]